MGYHRAGFDVVGVDIRPQPRYPFEFVQADALRFPLDGFDAIHASPPCQAHTSMKTMHNALPHSDLVPEMRRRLRSTGVPWVIENVVGAPLIAPVLLCGTMFGLRCNDAELRRHRFFEPSRLILGPSCRHRDRSVIGIYGKGCRDSRRKFDKSVAEFGVEHGRIAMGIDWMTLAELCQAIPPAYTEFVGREIMGWMDLGHAC